MHKIDELTSGSDAKDTRTQVAIVGSAGKWESLIRIRKALYELWCSGIL